MRRSSRVPVRERTRAGEPARVREGTHEGEKRTREGAKPVRRDVFFERRSRAKTARGGRFEMRQEFLIVSSLPLRLDPIDHDSLLAAEGHQQSACSDGSVLRCLARRFDISFLY